VVVNKFICSLSPYLAYSASLLLNISVELPSNVMEKLHANITAPARLQET